MALNRSIIQKEKNFWKQHKIKIASTLIAIFIWFLVVTRDSYEFKTTIPIVLIQDNPDYVITSPKPEKAYVLLNGTGRYLISYVLFREGSLRLEVEGPPGRKILHPTDDDISKTGNAGELGSIRYLSPDSIIVDIEKLVIKEIPVQNNITIKPLASYVQVGDVTMEPDVVRVQGPETALAKLDYIRTPTKIISDQKFPFHETFELEPPDNDVIKLLDTEVEIAVEIQQLLEKKLTDITVSVRYLPSGISALIQPKHIDLMIQGGIKVVKDLKSKDIDAYVEYSAGMDTLASHSIIIEPIKEVTFRDLSTDQVKVTLQEEDQ
jgi:YbbR domain-containing protein